MLLACVPAAAQIPPPLPPKRPAAIARVPAAPAPRMALRSAPLPPSRPPEIAALRAQEEDGEDQGAEARPAPAPLPAPRSMHAPEPPREGAPDAPAQPALRPGELPAACAALVAEGAMRAVADPPLPTRGGCSLPQPVRLTGVRLHDGRMVPLKPAAIAGCETAAAFAAWIAEDVSTAVEASGAAIEAVEIAASYECRPRNRVAGAKMSEHGIGRAVDLGGLELTDRRVLKVEKGGLPRPLRDRMKDSACTRFTTVLGPGSDGYHEDHIHVDLAQRRGDYRLCRWNLDAGTLVAQRREVAPAAAASPPAGESEEEQATGTEAAVTLPAAPLPTPVPRGARAPGR